MSDIISRKEARELGLPTYFDGEFCEEFHISERFTSSGKCCECSKESHSDFLNSSRAKKAEKKINNREKRETKRLARIEESKLYEEIGVKAYEFEQEDLEELSILPKTKREAKQIGTQYYFTGKACVNNHLSKRLTSTGACIICEKARKRMEVLLSPENRRASRSTYRKRKFAAGGKYTSEDIKELFEIQRGKCVYCEKCLVEYNYHVDHIMPVRLGGRNSKENLQLLCPNCNMRKGGKHPEEFLRLLKSEKFNYEDHL